jgi:hypothetical protein
MERLFGLLCEGVHRFEGTVDKFTGDGIMALFGAPIAHEDHARRACYAALRLRDSALRYAEELRRSHGIEFAVRLGLNSGEVVVGAIGDDLKLDYTALGHAVNLAQRMESLAEPGKAYVSAATASLVEGYVDLRPVGLKKVKGLAEPVAVFELVKLGRARTALEVAAGKGLSPFGGRNLEMAMLEDALASLRDGEGATIGVIAEPAVGKSRLCHEFSELCQTRGVDVFTAHGLAHSQSVPFAPVLEMLRAQLGVTDEDDIARARRLVAEAVLALDDSLGDALPVLYDFLGVAAPASVPSAVDAEARQRQLFAALDRLHQRRLELGPIVIVAEDLHWFDDASEAFMTRLANDVPGQPLLLLATCRPEYRPPWADSPRYTALALAPLDESASGTLLRALLGNHPSVDGLAEHILGRTGGNPLFIEEVVQGLAEEGYFVGQRGRFELARTVGEVRIPATAQAVLGARIDRLAEREKALVQAASVVGRRFSGPVVGRVSGLGGECRPESRCLVCTSGRAPLPKPRSRARLNKRARPFSLR